MEIGGRETDDIINNELTVNQAIESGYVLGVLQFLDPIIT
jgi:hypothetical protein